MQLRRTKFGLVVVLRCTKQAGSLKVGFLVEPEDRLRAVAKRIEKLHAAYHAAPIYGVDVAVQQQGKVGSAEELGVN